MSTHMHPINITPKDYLIFCQFLEEISGIVLGSDKLYLVKTRLNGLMQKHQIYSMEQLIECIKAPGETILRERVVDAMTTNETNWFRDAHPYTILTEKVFPEYKGKDRLRIWSAACSTGQEPHTISICVTEYLDKNPLTFSKNVEILGTDISQYTIERAKLGEYDEIEMSRGMSEERKARFFERTANGCMRIKEKEHSRITFRVFNLLSSYVLLGKFDIIFCRNVLIYFSHEVKLNILNRLADSLNNDGYLFLGASESIPGGNGCFKMINHNPGILYKKG